MSRATFVPHPSWATHAMRGFASRADAFNHANINAPDPDFGIRCIGKRDFEWWWPKEEPTTSPATRTEHTRLLRPVTVRRWEKDAEGFTYSISEAGEPGFFHAWTTETEIHESGFEHYSAAIIEFHDGRVAPIQTALITFD